MKIVRQVAVDLLVTLFILIVVLINTDVLNVILVIFTVVLLLARLSVLGNKEMHAKLAKKQPDVPPWFYHVLNGVNVVLLLAGKRWLLTVCWGLIWFLSWKTHQKTKEIKAARTRKQKPRR